MRRTLRSRYGPSDRAYVVVMWPTVSSNTRAPPTTEKQLCRSQKNSLRSTVR